MGTFILLMSTTIAGQFIGQHWWDQAIIGSVVGFFVGLILRVGAAGGLGDVGDVLGDLGGFD